MKIIFSPYYDGEKYIDHSQTPIIDKTYVGPLGLLSELELRAGLTCTHLPEIERQAMYLLALKQYIATRPNSMFAQSFNVDDFGVATELLRWRDALIKAGWDFKLTGVSEKLDTLSLIEREFNSIGESDRWANIITQTEIGNILPAGWEIEVQICKDLLPPVFLTIFDNLERQGVKVSYVGINSSAADGTNLYKIQEGLENQEYEIDIASIDGSLRIIKFKRRSDAYEWAAQQDWNAENTVIANENRKTFNNVLFSHGKARSGSIIKNSNPQIVQLFKLGLSLFIKPLNVYNLLSYLQVRINPLPSDLRYQLTDILINTGGIGKDWSDAIANYEFKDADGNVDSVKKENRLVFLEMVSGANDGCIKTVDLKKYIAAMHAWSTGRLNMDSTTDTDIREQLSNINTFCETLLILVNNTSAETVSYEQLKSWILSIYRPSDYTHEDAQMSSVVVVESSAAIVDMPDRLVWLDCYDRSEGNYPFVFLNNTEMEYLRNNGVRFLNKDLQNKSTLWAVKNSLRKVSGNLDIVMSAEHNGKKLPLHPIIIELQERLKDKFELLVVDESDLPVRVEQNAITLLPKPKVEYRFDGRNVQPRAQESFSSLEKLILFPFDYTLEYFARLSDKGVRQIQDLERTKGNVAHKIIETLAADSGRDTARFSELSRTEFDVRFRQAVDQAGVVLMLEENMIELQKFKIKVRDSLATLVTIIQNNGLNIVGCEVPESAEFEGMPVVETRIDLLLTNRNGEYVIFDLKWSSSNYHRNMLAENKAMQLEIYRAVVETKYADKKVAVTGYYMLPRGELITANTTLFKQPQVKVVEQENDAEVMPRILNSYQYRYSQFKDGVMEEGEGMEIDAITYYQDTLTQGLYPLNTEYGADDIKAVNKFSSYGTLKGHLE